MCRIGEPIWADRSEAELSECRLHEALLNVAFADAPDFRLVCPYDTVTLPGGEIELAHRHHPLMSRDGGVQASDGYGGSAAALARLGEPLPDAPATADTLPFDGGSLGAVRRFAARHAKEARLDARRRDDLVLAVTEAATNSVRHASGKGTARAWRDGATLVVEIRDDGRIADPLAGRSRPSLDRPGGGWGLGLVNHLCDLSQLRTSPSGTVLRLHMHAPAVPARAARAAAAAPA